MNKNYLYYHYNILTFFGVIRWFGYRKKKVIWGGLGEEHRVFFWKINHWSLFFFKNKNLVQMRYYYEKKPWSWIGLRSCSDSGHIRDWAHGGNIFTLRFDFPPSKFGSKHRKGDGRGGWKWEHRSGKRLRNEAVTRQIQALRNLHLRISRFTLSHSLLLNFTSSFLSIGETVGD